MCGPSLGLNCCFAGPVTLLQDLLQNMDCYRDQIQALMDQIHQVDPYMVILPEKEQGNGNSQQSPPSGSVHIVDISGGSRRHQKASQQSAVSKVADLCVHMTSSATYADIAAGRSSPCPFLEQVEEKDDKMKHLPRKTVITRTVMEIKDNPKQDRNPEMPDETKCEGEIRKGGEPEGLKVHDFRNPLKFSEKVQDVGASLMSSTVSLQSEGAQSVGSQGAVSVSQTEKCRPSRHGRSQQRKDAQERKNTDKSRAHISKTQCDASEGIFVKPEVQDMEVISCEEVRSQHPATRTSERAQVHKKHHHIVLKEPQETLKPQVLRRRSPSPMWNPGSTSYADILRGRQVSDGHEETIPVMDLKEVNMPILENSDINGEKVQECYRGKYQYQEEDWSLPESHKTVAGFQHTEDVYVSAADENPVQNVENYSMDHTLEMRGVEEKVASIEEVDTGAFLEEEVIAPVHEHDVTGVTVASGVFEYVQQPTPDVVGFITSGQQLLNSGLGTYHKSAHQYIMSHDGDQSPVYPVTATQQPSNQYETLSLEYVQPSIESVAYTTPVHQEFTLHEYDISQQADPDVSSSLEVTPVHNTRRSKKVRSGQHSQTEVTTITSTSVADEEVKPLIIHGIESDDQTGSTGGIPTELDKCQLSYAQILAQGLCAKPLQPSSQAVNMYINRNDRSLSPRATSPGTSYSQEWSASPSCNTPSTVREEVVRCAVADATTTVPKLEDGTVKKMKDKVKKETGGLTHVSGPPSGDQQQKFGKGKQKKKKQTLTTNLESTGIRGLLEENKEQVPVLDVQATADANSGEPFTVVTSSVKSVVGGSLASVKDRSVGYKKSKPLYDGRQQNIHSEPVSQISPHNCVPVATEGDDAAGMTMSEQVQFVDEKQDGLTDQEKKKRLKKKKLGKNAEEDEIEKALKEIAVMEMSQSKHKNKNIEMPQEAKVNVMEQEKECTKYKKVKTATHTDNASLLIHKAEPEQVAAVGSSAETNIVIEGTNSQECNSSLQDKQDKNPEIVASEQKNVNIVIPKTDQSKKKKKRGKKLVGCNVPGSKHVMEEPKIHSSYMDCETDSIQSGQNVLLTQKLKLLSDVTDATNLVEAESTGMKKEISEHFQGGSIVVEEKSRTPQFECVEIPNQESFVPPPDLLADIQHETEFLKTSEIVSVADHAIPLDKYCKQKEADISATKQESKLRETSTLPISKGKRSHRKRKNPTDLAKEEVSNNVATTLIGVESQTTTKYVPLKEEHKLGSKFLSVNKEDNSQKVKLHDQAEKTHAPEVVVQSPHKRKGNSKRAKAVISRQCESPHSPKQEPVENVLISEQDRLRTGDDMTTDVISVKQSTEGTDFSSKETLLSTKLGGAQDRDTSKGKQISKKSRKGKHKPVTEKELSMEQTPEENEHDKNGRQAPMDTSDKCADLLVGTREHLDVPVEEITITSGVGVGDADTGDVEVATTERTRKGKSKKSKKSKSTLKDIEEIGKDMENAIQDTGILKGVKTVGTDLDQQPLNKVKRSSKTSKKHKAATWEQNKSIAHSEDAAVDSNRDKRQEVVEDDRILSDRDLISETDSVYGFKQLEHAVHRSRKSNKKSECGGSVDEQNKHLSKQECVNAEQDMLMVKSEEDLPLPDRKSEPDDQISESFEKQIPCTSGDTDQCMKLVAKTENVQEQITVATLPAKENAHDADTVKSDVYRDIEYNFVPETPLPDQEVPDDCTENHHEQDEGFTSTQVQQELSVVQDERSDTRVNEIIYKLESEHHDSADENTEKQKDDISFTSVSDKELDHKYEEIHEHQEYQTSTEASVSLDSILKFKKHDAKKEDRHTMNVREVEMQVNVPRKIDNEIADICSTPPVPPSLPESKKQLSGTPLVSCGTSSSSKEDLDTVVLTPNWMEKSSALQNVSTVDSSIFKCVGICDFPGPSIVDMSDIVQDQANDSSLTSSVAASPDTHVPLMTFSTEIAADSRLAQEIVNTPEGNTNIEVPGIQTAGIFGSVKERTRKPRKIIDTLTVDEKAAQSVAVATHSAPEKKKKTPKSPVQGHTKKGDGKVKMAEEPKDIEEDEEYRVMKDKMMKKKKKRPKIPVEFTNPQFKVENEAEVVTALNLDAEVVNKHKSDEITHYKPETVSLVTEVASYGLHEIAPDIRIDSDLASMFVQPVSPIITVINEQPGPETPYLVGDSSLSDSKMKPVLLKASPMTVSEESFDTSLRVCDIQSLEEKMADIPQEVKFCSLCPSNELIDVVASAVDESFVFKGGEEEVDGNTILPASSAGNIVTDDALVKIQETVIAVVRDALCESELKAETAVPVVDHVAEPVLKTEVIPAVGNEVLSDSELRIEAVPTVKSDDVLDPGQKAEEVTLFGKDVPPECDLKTEESTLGGNYMLSEPGLKAEEVTVLRNDSLSESAMKTEEVKTIGNDVLSESDLNTAEIIRVGNVVVAEPDLNTESFSACANNVCSDAGLKSADITAAANYVFSEPDLNIESVSAVTGNVCPGLKTETLSVIAGGVLSEPCLRTEIITTLTSDVLSEPCLKTAPITTVASDLCTESGLKIETVPAVAGDVLSELSSKTEAVATFVNDLSCEMGPVTETVTSAANDVLAEFGMMTETAIAIVNDEFTESDPVTKTVNEVSDMVVSAPSAMTVPGTTVVNDEFYEPGLMTESVTVFADHMNSEHMPMTELFSVVVNDVISESGLKTETTCAVKPVVQTVESVSDICDAAVQPVTYPCSKEIAYACLDDLELAALENDESVRVEGVNTEIKISETVVQKPSSPKGDVVEKLEVSVADCITTDVCHNPFMAEVLVQEVKPRYYLYRDAEMYWQEKVAQEVFRVSSLPSSHKKQGLKSALEKSEYIQELPAVSTKQLKFEAPLNESPRNKDVFEVQTYDIRMLLDAEKRWHEFKKHILMGDNTVILEKPENSHLHAETEVTERFVDRQVINGDSLTDSPKEASLPEPSTSIYTEFEEAEIIGSDSTFGGSRKALSFDIIGEVTAFIEEELTDAQSSLELQENAALVEDGATQLNFLDREKSELKFDETVGISFAPAPEKDKTEMLHNLYKEDVWLESYKFLDAEKEWNKIQSKVLPKELLCEEDIGSMQTAVVKSQGLVRNGNTSNEELKQQQHRIEVMAISTCDTAKLEGSEGDVPSLQDVSQDPEMKSFCEQPKHSTDDICSSQIVSQDQVLMFSSSELSKESTDTVSTSEGASQEAQLKPGSNLTKDEMQFVLHQGYRAEACYCPYDIHRIHDAERQYQEQIAGLKKGVQDSTLINKKEKVSWEVPRSHCMEYSYCHYDVFALGDAEKQHKEQLALSQCVDTKTNELMDVAPVLEINSKKPDVAVQGFKKQEIGALQTESANGSLRTWATVVASKKPSSPQETGCEGKLPDIVLEKHSVSKVGDLQEPPRLSVNVCVEEPEGKDTNVPVVEVDPEGFMEFVPKRELRKRKSRSRSRGRCKDNVALPEKSQEVSVSDVQTTETDYARKQIVSPFTSKSSEDFPEHYAVDTENKVKGSDAGYYTAREDKTSFNMTQSGPGKEVQTSFKKCEKAEVEMVTKRYQTSEKPPAQKMPLDLNGRQPLSDEQEVEGIVHVRKELVQHYLLDGAFWPDKCWCHDAECEWEEVIAQCQKKPLSTMASLEIKLDRTRDHRDDSDDGSSGHSSPGPHNPRRGGEGGRGLGESGDTTEHLSADLPGGICGWPDESTYLSGFAVLGSHTFMQNVPEDDRFLAAEEEHASYLAHRVAEEVFTDLVDEQESEFPIYPPSSTTHEVQPSCRSDDSTSIFVVQMKVGDLRNPLFSMCYVFLRA